MPSKQELDKEKMFRKIMPSAPLPPSAQAKEAGPAAGLHDGADKGDGERKPVQAATAAGEEPATAGPPAAQQAVPAPGPAAPGAAGPAPGDEPPRPVNLAEVLIVRLYPRYRQRLNGCACGKCRDDACGMALNKIKPRYLPSNRIPCGALEDRELLTETVTALMKALFLVKRRPRHSEQDLKALSDNPPTGL